MKKGILILAFVIAIVVISRLQLDRIVPMQARFPGKLVYGYGGKVSRYPLQLYIVHCALHGGVFAACGSPCEKNAIACELVCAYTCESLF